MSFGTRVGILLAVSGVYAFGDAANALVTMYPTTLDLFRFSLSDNPTNAAEFATKPRDLVPGDPAVFNDITNQYQMSTGLITPLFPNGDGRQASHWKDDALTGQPYIGVMDPTLGSQTIENLKASDIQALDLIGYNIGPSYSGPNNFHINLINGGGLTGDVLAAFNRAAAQWEAVIHDPITVNIVAGLQNLGSSTIIGGTNSALLIAGYTPVRSALIGDGTAAADTSGDTEDNILSSLPVSPSFYVPNGYSLGGIKLTSANFKAIGGTFLDDSDPPQPIAYADILDASIIFNTNFNFDFDPENDNVIAAGKVDFETVALHEIGHALGFISSIDDINVPEPMTSGLLFAAAAILVSRRRR